MPIQTPQWTEYLSCPICYNMFNETLYRPISLACGHTICKSCLGQLKQKKCPFDQNALNRDINELPVNLALLQLVGVALPELQEPANDSLASNSHYITSRKCIEDLAIFLKPVLNGTGGSTNTLLSRPMQRKLVALVNCQLVEEEGRMRAMRAARTLGERTVTELILQHQNPQQLSTNLWAAVRARGCQFLGPAMQEEVLKLILLALEDGSALSRKVLVLFVVQRLEVQYPQASKTAIGHVVQLLYRASCFMVTKRNEESSLMQLKDEFRVYESLRREHDTQIVQIATEAGLRISPEQWSSLLYGDTMHKSHMQSIIDKLQTPQSFPQSIQELVIALQRTGDPGQLSRLQPQLDLLSNIDPAPEAPAPTWENLEAILKAIKTVVQGLVDFMKSCSQQKAEPQHAHSAKYKTSMCRDLTQKGSCPRGSNCSFAHSQDELERFRARHRRLQKQGYADGGMKVPTSSALTSQEQAELAAVTKSADAKLIARAAATAAQTLTEKPGQNMHRHPGAKLLVDERQKLLLRPSASISVPVVKAMPMMQKGAPLRQMIYSSPTIARYNPQSEVIPITGLAEPLSQKDTRFTRTVPRQPRVVPPRQNVMHCMRIVGENPYYEPTPGDMTALHAEHPTIATKRRHGAGLMTYRYVLEPTAPRRLGDRRVVMEEVVDMMSLPPNPYTEEYYVSDMEEATPAEHLEVLHRRKKELLEQLHKSKLNARQNSAGRTRDPSRDTKNHLAESTSTFSTTVPVMSSTTQPVIYCRSNSSPVTLSPSVSASSSLSDTSIQSGSSGHDVNASDNEQARMSSLAQSLADSMATTLTTKNLPKQNHSERTIESVMCSPDGVMKKTSAIPADDYDPAYHTLSTSESSDSYIPWSSGDSHDVPNDLDVNYDSYGEYDDGFAFRHVLQTPGIGESEFDGCDSLADDDEFIPFYEHATVSKYGPISRMERATNTKNSAPVQVTASSGQKKEMMTVTSITPVNRPYPISAEVTSQYHLTEAGPEQRYQSLRHHKDLGGMSVAASLPTALMQPSLLVTGTSTSLLVSSLPNDSDTRWSLKEQVLNMPGHYPSSEQEQIHNELLQLTKQINHLEMSEHERLARELESVELNIQEVELHREWMATADQQEVTAKKHSQDAQHRRIAHQVVLDDANSLSDEG